MFLNRIARPCCYLMDGILMRPSLSIKCAALAVLTAASPAVFAAPAPCSRVDWTHGEDCRRQIDGSPAAGAGRTHRARQPGARSCRRTKGRREAGQVSGGRRHARRRFAPSASGRRRRSVAQPARDLHARQNDRRHQRRTGRSRGPVLRAGRHREHGHRDGGRNVERAAAERAASRSARRPTRWCCRARSPTRQLPIERSKSPARTCGARAPAEAKPTTA